MDGVKEPEEEPEEPPIADLPNAESSDSVSSDTESSDLEYRRDDKADITKPVPTIRLLLQRPVAFLSRPHDEGRWMECSDGRRATVVPGAGGAGAGGARASGAGAGGAGAGGAGAGGAGAGGAKADGAWKLEVPDQYRPNKVKRIRKIFATATSKSCVDLWNGRNSFHGKLKLQHGTTPWAKLESKRGEGDRGGRGDNRRDYNRRQNQRRANAEAMTNAVPNDNDVCPKCKNNKHNGDCWKCRAMDAQQDPKVVTERKVFDIIIRIDWLSINESANFIWRDKEDVPVIRDFPGVFPDELPRLPPPRQVEFRNESYSGGLRPVHCAISFSTHPK
ncbi:hypothetical protein Tco_0266774 [Tanacetum coccineum]